jgi:hypothetical protein
VPLAIIIGTGRCGSTMLSHMLHLHPRVLSLSEFWNLFPGRDINSSVTGEEFCAAGASAFDLLGSEQATSAKLPS